MPKSKITKDEALQRVAISKAEFAALTGVSLSSVNRHVETGRVPSYRLQSRILIPGSFIQEIFGG